MTPSRSRPSTHSAMLAACLGFVLAVLSSLPLVARPALAQSPQAATTEESPRTQIHVYWGGGTPRSWNGTIRLADPSGRGQIPWAWRSDCEAGDVAGGLRAGSSLREQGIRITGRTEGDADGLLLEWLGSRDATIRIHLGDAILDARISSLVGNERIVDADDAGNVLLLRAIDLDGNASLDGIHAGLRVHRVCLHTHSIFSDGDSTLDTELQSLRPFVRRIWWTDHDLNSVKPILEGSFDDPDQYRTYWDLGSGSDGGSTFELDPDARAGSFALRLSAEDSRNRRVLAWINPLRRLEAGLPVRPRLRFSWKIPESSAVQGILAFVRVTLASQQEYICTSDEAPAWIDIPSVVVPTLPGEWVDVERDLLDDENTLLEGGDADGLFGIDLGIYVPPGASGSVLFDEVQLVMPPPPEPARAQRRYLERFPDFVQHQGIEESLWWTRNAWGRIQPHFTLLLPGDDLSSARGFDHPPSAQERRGVVDAVHAAGGVVGVHHMEGDPNYERLMADAGYGVDLFEITSGWLRKPSYDSTQALRDRDAHDYPREIADELFPILVRWDRTTARGLVLTGYGAPDLHSRFDRSHRGFYNRWLTWILSESDSPRALLRALRRGRAVGSEWGLPSIVTLEEEHADWMGKIVVTNRDETTLRARVSGAGPRYVLRLVAGPLLWDGAMGEDPEADSRSEEVGSDSGASASPIEIRTLASGDLDLTVAFDSSHARFVRPELWNPAGRLAAYGNPIHFVRSWPRQWPFGRVAFDWSGVRLAEERGLLLSDARLEPDGSLRLRADLFGETGQIRLTCAHRTPVRVDVLEGEATWDWEEASRSIRIESFTGEAVTVRLSFDDPLPQGETGEVLSIPERKRRILLWELGRSDADDDAHRITGVFEEHPRGAYHARWIEEPKVSFRLSLPAHGTCWLRIYCQGSPHGSGILRVEDQELGSFGAWGHILVEVPPMQVEDSSTEATIDRDFTIELSAPPDRTQQTSIRISRIEVYTGPGVIEY